MSVREDYDDEGQPRQGSDPRTAWVTWKHC